LDVSQRKLYRQVMWETFRNLAAIGKDDIILSPSQSEKKCVKMKHRKGTFWSIYGPFIP
jgi:hypothetical protein